MSSDLLTPLESIDTELATKLEQDVKFRNRYIRFWAQTEVASEIKSLRKARRLKQSDLAKLVDTGQSAVSRIEKADYDGWTFKTLVAVAEALRARLNITLEPIENVASKLRGGENQFLVEGDATSRRTVTIGSDNGYEVLLVRGVATGSATSFGAS